MHSLEHGRILLQYATDTPLSEVVALTRLYKEPVLGSGASYHMLIMRNNTKMPFQTAAVAWRHYVGCKDAGPKAIAAMRAFRDRYVDKGPEFVPYGAAQSLGVFGWRRRGEQVRYVRLPVTVRPSAAVAVIATVKRPLGRPVRFTGAVMRSRVMVLTRLPRTLTTAPTNVMPGRRRTRMRKLRRLTQALAGGSENADDAEIGFSGGWAAGVPGTPGRDPPGAAGVTGAGPVAAARGTAPQQAIVASARMAQV